ncbi:MAG: addiction module toxin RelE [Proteobacteria bacterium ST_bin11]|nr:MAG: addiction module toxin RelE [Proteobacteria bacterium ST_bin11]
MTRPLRLEFPNALYHITSRGDRREDIYEDVEDRLIFLSLLGKVVGDFNWLCHGYCLMTNHYHLIVETLEGNLSKGMRQLNGVYTQTSNRRHGRTGHLFQGRYKAILVDKESYLLELARYVVLNPARAGMVRTLEDWPWSSYLAMTGQVKMADWLTTDWILSQFGENRAAAEQRYRVFVQDGMQQTIEIWHNLKNQIYLGDEEFVAKVQQDFEFDKQAWDIPKKQKRGIAKSLFEIERQAIDRNTAIKTAYATGVYSQREIGAHFNLHPSTVSVIVRHDSDS